VLFYLQREPSPDKLAVVTGEPTVPDVELHGNPSAFAVYSGVRRVVLEEQTRQV